MANRSKRKPTYTATPRSVVGSPAASTTSETSAPTTPLPSPQAPSSSWRDHPIVIAALAVAGTVAVAVPVVKDLVLPVVTASLDSEVKRLTARVADLEAAAAAADASATSSKREAQETKTEADQQLADLRKKLRSAQLATLYQHGSVYPSGLGTVRMGMSISKVREAFDRKTIEEKDSYLSVKTGHAVFRDVTYYFAEADKDQIISHVSFRYDEGDKDLVQSKLVEALGPPSNIPKAGYFEWSRGEVGVFHHSGFMSSVIVMNSQWRPGYWPEGKGK